MEVETKLARIAEISTTKPKEIFTSIYHLLNEELLLKCHRELDGKKATGLDGVTKAKYEANLRENLENLAERLRRLAYKPAPAKRVYIPKANGKVRGLAIATYEDKIVQLALTKILEAIFEPKLCNNMYGFRHNRSCHKAVKELTQIIHKKKINYVVDADIKGFFDNIDQKWLISCVEQHIKDPRIIRLIIRFLKAGIMEDGVINRPQTGTPQGSILSPILANIYMHYVLALWFELTIKKNFKGDCEIIIYADDYISCFQYQNEAELYYQKLLPERLSKFNLELEPSKTRMIKFGRFAGKDAETFDFLGFTFYCSKDKKGYFRAKTKTAKKKYKSKIKEFKAWIKENRHMPLKNLIDKINEKLRGHIQYFGVTHNFEMISKFRYTVIRTLYKWLNRRSQAKSYTWEEFKEMLEVYPIVKAKICVNMY